MKGMFGVSWNSLQGQSGVKEKEIVPECWSGVMRDTLYHGVTLASQRQYLKVVWRRQIDRRILMRVSVYRDLEERLVVYIKLSQIFLD